MLKKVKKNFIQINSIFIFGVLLILSSFVPYVNLIISESWYWSVFLLFIFFVFKLSARAAVIIGILLLIVSTPWIIAGSRVGSEIFGVLTFMCMVYAIFKEILQLRKSL